MNTADRQNDKQCLLLFSGGRDSTLAAIQLAKQFSHIILATVTSDHLIGVEQVFARLSELSLHLPITTRHLVLQQPHFSFQDNLAPDTCLPCHRAYVACSVLLAKHLAISHIALGYAGYQNAWPEQSLPATTALRAYLATQHLTLHLPVYGLSSKASAISRLTQLGISATSLEQKCSKQISNISLSPHALPTEIQRWITTTTALVESLRLDRLLISSDTLLATHQPLARA